MKGRLNLADKFSVIASILDPVGGSGDVERFLAAKKLRDGYFHAMSEAPGPQASVALLSKYLSLHLLAGS